MAKQNKMFAGGLIQANKHHSKIRHNREYLLSQSTAEEFNTYNYFGVFNTFNDVYEAKYDKNTGYQIFDPKETKGPGTPGVRSLFSNHGAVLLGLSTPVDANKFLTRNDYDKYVKKASEFRIANNVPLLDSPSNRKKIRQHSGCSIKELVQFSESGQLGRAIYSYSDFMYCKHLGKVSNNYLITLRRFPFPVLDFINGLGVGKTRTDEGKNMGPQQIGCLVNWLGVSGNEMGNILKYSVTMPYKEQNSQWNSVEGGDADSANGVLNGIAAAFDPAYRKQFTAGYGGNAMSKFMGKFGATTGPYSASQENSWVDQNKVYGPVDKVKKTYMRSEDGIDFKQNITVVFEYELRAYNGINGRQAMLDLISNILNVTYTTGGFWGGGYRGGGMHQNSIFQNLNIFKCKGGFTDFMDAFAQDYSDTTAHLRTKLNTDFGGNILSMLKSALNAIGGMILGGALNSLGRPAKTFANSLLSEQPVGFWHLTVGNPHHPIMSVGNMVLKNTTIEHYGPLGLDDFPTSIKVTCELDRGKPRDIREIEKMYMQGNDRIYHGMTKKIADMYKKAAEYRNSGAPKTTSNTNDQIVNAATAHIQSLTSPKSTADVEITTAQSNVEGNSQTAVVQEVTPITEDDLKVIKNVLRKYYGESDTYSVYIPAGEQEYGASKKSAKKEETPSGSSDNTGTAQADKTDNTTQVDKT